MLDGEITCYCTNQPCVTCAKMLVNANVKRIVYEGDYPDELAATIASALRGHTEIALGNVIGSNMFNLLAVLGLPGIIHPGPVEGAVLTRDFPVMAVFTVALLIMAYGFRTWGRINRLEGGLLLGGYLAYQTLLYFTARS